MATLFSSSDQNSVSILNSSVPAKCNREHKQSLLKLYLVYLVLMGMALSSKILPIFRNLFSPSSKVIPQQKFEFQNTKTGGRWRKRMLVLGFFVGMSISVWIYFSMNAAIGARRKEILANMCDERARMLQDQFNVSLNHVNAMAILISTFHHGKKPSAIDQKTFAEYIAKTAFERPLISGIAYALKVMHYERAQFEKEQGWEIKKMETDDQSPIKDDYAPEKLNSSHIQDEYAPIIYTQEAISHIVSIDIMSEKEDRDNIMRARVSGKGVLTSPFKLLKCNKHGVVLTFAVYKNDISPYAAAQERIDATIGYLGAVLDIASLVERLLHQLESKQTIIVNVYDTTNSSSFIKMYGHDDVSSRGEVHASNVDFGDSMRSHAMHCRLKYEPPPPWSAITTSLGVAVIVLLVGHIFNAAINRIEKVEDDYRKMKELKVRAEAVDVAKSQFLTTLSHEIRTPMNGVLGMLQMLLDTELDATQQDYAVTAQESGKALVLLINEFLDEAKMESGRLELEAVPFDIRVVLDNVLSLFSEKSQVKGIELAVYISNQVPEVLIGDPGRFRQVITNLVGNSVKFIEAGHIFVSVHLIEEMKTICEVNDHAIRGKEEPFENSMNLLYDTLSGFRVVDRCKSWENFRKFDSAIEATDAVNILVTVEDTGPGIPKGAQEHIFMPFMQADSSTSRMYGGTGIGLSISKCLVDLMGGEIGFASELGVGSSFSFTTVFKKGLKNLVDVKRHTEIAVSDFQGMRGLVVDGMHIRANVTKYHLQRLGIDVKVATDPKSAHSMIMDACSPCGTELLDMVLVEKDAWDKESGLPFVRPIIELKQNGKLKSHDNIPKMLLLTASLSSSTMDSIKLAGLVDSIIKPLRLSMLTACLRKALGFVDKRHQDAEQLPSLKSLLRGRQILVVDDNLVNLKVATCALKKYGAEVQCAEGGMTAVELLHPPHKFDACFMDVQMPELDGFEATRRIRDIERRVNKLIESRETSVETYDNVEHWHIPILAMTADVFQASHDECVRCGMDDYVSKPFEIEQLYSSVARFFESNSESSVS